ncbi:COX15/CtaA family protein [Sulfuriflexus sp.]|uniref:COX15/CtaA family protein n=1 Tax=Sulfuriflexus sp. TaxID=2015443 RepID=UPI0028CEA264|nr:COX15/CtaA family protein [Sulfuriflexus sp.]MDT8404171.1 COX15/CtaA family protein [Sulfuriflexus sp.]
MDTSLPNEQRDNRQLAYWLLTVCALIFAMVVLGGVTRLTHSGLSMVEWKPIVGSIPPLSEQEWQETLQKYRSSPEYQKKNKGMSIAEFKSIFWFEYTHRLLGRLIGLAFLLPFLYFLVRGKIRRRQIPTFITMFFLGGLQGLLGWYMVKSGLVDVPQVSQYRLTAHLVAAITIYLFILWVALSLLRSGTIEVRDRSLGALKRHGQFTTAIIILMIISGGFVAGTKAGFVFNTFPMMDGQWLPPGGMALQPWWLNLFENMATIQFNHRLLAVVVSVVIFTYALRGWRSRAISDTTCFTFTLLFMMLLIQLGLGISTLVYVVPVALGAAHQAGALLLLTIAVILNHRLRVH